MGTRKRVIIITDGDDYARKAVEVVAKEIGGRCFSMSHGNPTVLTGSEIVNLIGKAQEEPILVMFDDSGIAGVGAGERALSYVVNHPNIEVLGALAVAAKAKQVEWTKIDVSIDRRGELTPYGVDKNGEPELEIGRLYGDTVYSLDSLNIPLVVGIGDIGKMSDLDSYEIGAPITRKAIELILERSGFYHDKKFDDRKNSNSYKSR